MREGAWLRFLAMDGRERWKLAVSDDTTLFVVSKYLDSAWHKGRLGPRIGRVVAILPGGQILSDTHAAKTVETCFVTRAARPGKEDTTDSRELDDLQVLHAVAMRDFWDM